MVVDTPAGAILLDDGSIKEVVGWALLSRPYCQNRLVASATASQRVFTLTTALQLQIWALWNRLAEKGTGSTGAS